MYQSIQSALGDQWLMFFHPKWPVDLVRPVCDLASCLDQCNRTLSLLGPDVTTWPVGDQYQVARLLRLNWIHGRLDREPIRKPILVHGEGSHLVVDCGDTRVMALRLAGQRFVSVVATDSVLAAARYQDWTPVRTDDDLRHHTGFSPDADIFLRVGQKQAIEWLEIGDETTAHHLHDFDQRIRMMKNYLLEQPSDFCFDEAWARTVIDWQDIDPACAATNQNR